MAIATLLQPQHPYPKAGKCDRDSAPSATIESTPYPFAFTIVKPHTQLPRGSELLCSDNTPADDENQIFIPNYLLFLLGEIWKERQDWYFGVDMGVYQKSSQYSTYTAKRSGGGEATRASMGILDRCEAEKRIALRQANRYSASSEDLGSHVHLRWGASWM